MELTDLQDMWNQHDKKLTENIHINKNILKNILLIKTEKKMNWMRAKAIIKLILPILLLTIGLIPRLNFRTEYSFIIGAIMFGVVFLSGYFWNMKYFLKLSQIDLRGSITVTRKEIIELEKYKFKTTKLGYILMPFAVLGIFMMFEVPIFSKETILPILLILVVMAVSIYVTFRFSIFDFFKKLNHEIEEIEKLEE